jgi:hypothetical protein
MVFAPPFHMTSDLWTGLLFSAASLALLARFKPEWLP